MYARPGLFKHLERSITRRLFRRLFIGQTRHETEREFGVGAFLVGPRVVEGGADGGAVLGVAAVRLARGEGGVLDEDL